jgi:hypothetical protein
MRNWLYAVIRNRALTHRVPLLCAAVTALMLGACTSTTTTLSSLPKELGGLPADTPAKPATQLAYPAVHDMPPPRTKAVLTEAELKRAEQELIAARDGNGKRKAAAASDTSQ